MAREPAPKASRIAALCLDRSARASRDPCDLPEAADAATRHLANQMTRRLGPARLYEASALVALGLTQAKAEHALLRGVDATVEGGLVGLSAAAAGHSDERVREAVVAILAHTLRFLTTLEGERVAWAVVREAYPDAVAKVGGLR